MLINLAYLISLFSILKVNIIVFKCLSLINRECMPDLKYLM